MDKKKNKEEKNVEQKQEVKEETTEILEEEHFKQPEEKSDTSKYEEEIKKLQEENKQLTDKIKLTQAELINYRKRKDEEVQTLLKYANVDIVSEILNVVDNFERAITHANDSENAELKKYNDGINMIYTNLKSILNKFGVEEINRVGEVFNPNEEQALLTDSVEDKEDEVVLEVLQKGYKLKDRVIRPASVKINQK